MELVSSGAWEEVLLSLGEYIGGVGVMFIPKIH